MTCHGLFFGLTTLDVVHFLPSALGRNEKAFDESSFVGAGGPATNAAITFAALGGAARLCSSVGCHPVASMVEAELGAYGVEHMDLNPRQAEPPPVASVLVSLDNGDRAVASSAGALGEIDAGLDSGTHLPDDVQVLLVDGFRGTDAVRLAAKARDRGVPVVLDGGSWKADSGEILKVVDFAVVSERFHPPDLGSEDLFDFIHRQGVPYVAQTRGERPILFSYGGERGELPVPEVAARDTLAAGDVFHGAFCFGIGRGWPFSKTLAFSAEVASQSCRYLGPREWIDRRADSSGG